MSHKFTKYYDRFCDACSSCWEHEDGRVAVCFAEDAYVPVMVELMEEPHERASATYFCALGTGDVDGYELTKKEYDWIKSFENEVAEWWNEQREGNPEFE